MSNIGDLTAKLVLDAKSFNQGLDTSVQKLGNITKDNAWSKIGEATQSIAKGFTIAGGAIVTAAGVATKSAVDFESAFTGVKKTIDFQGTEAEASAFFDGIRSDILKMSEVMPVAASEIAGVYEAAGQLGIQNENLTNFATAMIGLGSATNLSSQEAAVALAQFANVTKMAQTDFDKLGSSIVALGNNMATDERQITNFATELAVLKNMAGMSEADILGLGSAMASLGLESAASGTATQRLAQDMVSAVSRMNSSYQGFQYTTDMTFDKFMKGWNESGTMLDLFAYTSGMSAQKFAKNWKEDATGAFLAFIQGLGSQSTANQLQIFDALDIKQMREIDLLQRLAGNSQLVASAVKMSNDAWNQNSALTTEVSKRNEDTASQLQMVKNMAQELAIEAGTALLPIVKELLIQAKPLLDRITTYLRENPDTVVRVTKMGAALLAIGTTASGIVKVVTAVSSFITTIKTLGTAISVLTGGTTAVAGAGAVAGTTASVGGILGGVIAGIGAIAPVVLGVGAVVGTFALAWKNDWLGCKTHMSEAVEAFKRKKEETGSTLQALQAGVKTWTNGVAGEVRSWWDNNIAPFFSNKLSKVGEWVGNVKDRVSYGFETMRSNVTDRVRLMGDTVSLYFSNIRSNAYNVFENVRQTVADRFRMTGEAVSNALYDIKTKISNEFENVKYTVSDKMYTIKTTMENTFYTIKTNVSDTFYNIKTKIGSELESTRQAVYDKATNIRNTIENVFDNAKDSAVNTFLKMKSKVTESVDGMRSNIVEKIRGIGDTLSTSVTSIKDNVSRGFDNVKQSVAERMVSISNYVSDTFSSVKNKLSDIGSAISNAWNNAKSYASNTLSVNWWGGGYAEGGSITSGKAYLVGEEGPEIFVPRSSGYIMNNDETNDLIGGSGRTYQIIIQGDVYDDEASLRRKFHNAVMDILETELAYG